MAPGSSDSTSSLASTLDDVITQFQALTQHMAATNNHVDLLPGQFQQLSNDVLPLLVPAQFASTVYPQADPWKFPLIIWFSASHRRLLLMSVVFFWPFLIKLGVLFEM